MLKHIILGLKIILNPVPTELAHRIPLILILFKLFSAELVLDGHAFDVVKHPLVLIFVNLLELEVLALILVVMELHGHERLFVYKHAVFHLS